MAAWVTVWLVMWAAGCQSAEANQREEFVTCDIPAVKVGETATLTCRFPGNVTRRQISVQKYRRGSRGAPIPILDCDSLDGEPDCRHHDWRSIFDKDTMIREHEVIVKLPQAGPNDEREYKCQIPGYVHDKPCTFKLDNAPPIKGENTRIIALFVGGALGGALLLGAIAGGCVYIRWFKKNVRQKYYVENLHKKTRKVEEEIGEAQGVMKTKEDEMTKLMEDKSSLNSRLVMLKDQINVLREETKSLQSETGKLESDNIEMLKLKEDLEKVRKKRQDLKEEKEELLNTLNPNNDPLPPLQSEVDELKLKVEDLKGEESGLQKAKELYSEQLTKMKEMDAEKKQVEREKAELDEMLIKNEKETRKMLEDSGGLLKMFRKKKQVDERANEDLQGELQAEKDRNADLQTQLQRLIDGSDSVDNQSQEGPAMAESSIDNAI